MKRTIITIALATLSAVASAQWTSISEIDYHKYSKSPDKSVYWATGLAYSNDLGTFDGYVQGVRSYSGGVDNLHGAEFGFALPAAPGIGNGTFTPRLALGTMRNINMGGYNGNGVYLLGSVELDNPIREGLGGYVGYSHMRGLNAAAISSQNRIQAGLDFTLTPKLTVRAGYSGIRQYSTTQHGLVTMAFYSF
jgi:opacity protein-like surface antigen